MTTKAQIPLSRLYTKTFPRVKVANANHETRMLRGFFEINATKFVTSLRQRRCNGIWLNYTAYVIIIIIVVVVIIIGSSSSSSGRRVVHAPCCHQLHTLPCRTTICCAASASITTTTTTTSSSGSSSSRSYYYNWHCCCAVSADLRTRPDAGWPCWSAPCQSPQHTTCASLAHLLNAHRARLGLAR